ncbi:MAG: hypothetical protein M1834_003882 [Cirrosporium novae-zelandiae]|nr:MAG: hypothetical protein M1834_003882 [Cirrosporium novae-zelandiae]
MSFGQSQVEAHSLIPMSKHHHPTAFLSPPTSPSMSGDSSHLPCPGWQQAEPASKPPSPISTGQGMTGTDNHPPKSQNLRIDTHQPLGQPNKSYPQPLGSPIQPFVRPQAPFAASDSGNSLTVGHPSQPGKLSLNTDVAIATHESNATPGLGTRLTPVSAGAEHENISPKDRENSFSHSEGEDEDTNDESGRTAAEKRSDKRKMKRFRLTHNQTRFLMNEFAHQAHPDAAHRERLAREIPGLSPRQVQVWFQNRRAKLKRLTSDDRERMMKSRALPDDFDMSHALYSPFGGPHPMGTPLSSPASFGPGFPENALIRPLTMDSIRRQSDDSTVSPISMGSAYGSSFTPPSSGPPSENISPISTTSDRQAFSTFSGSQTISPRNPFGGRSSSFSVTNPYRTPIPRLQSHERFARSRAESLASPLRASMSYSTTSPDQDMNQSLAPPGPLYGHRYEAGYQSFSSNPPIQYGTSPLSGPYHGFQASAVTRLRPAAGFPSGLQLQSQYRSSRSSLPQTPTVFGYQSAPLAPPPDFQIPPQTSASWSSSPFPDIYGSTYSTPGVATTSSPLRNVKTEPEGPAGHNYNQPPTTSAGSAEIQHSFDGNRARSYTSPMDFNNSQ